MGDGSANDAISKGLFQSQTLEFQSAVVSAMMQKIIVRR